MKLSSLAARLLLSVAPLCAPLAARAALPRFPQPYGTSIVFVADGSVWTVPKTGGTATRLTSSPGQDMFPRVSPDGKWIAYTEASNAGTDVWVIPAAGGPARRLTFHPTTEAGTGGRHGPDNMVVTWTPDSKSVVYLTKRNQWNSWIQEMWQVPVEGGLPTAMPIDSAVGLATYGPDGHSIAYNRIFRNFRTWKRYNGGLAQQVFTYDFNSKQLLPVTNWSGTNTSPMWYNHKIYYLSDQDAHRRANIWVYDQDTKQTREVTHFTDLDIDFPALGSNAIAFQQAGKLYLLDLPSEQLHEVPLAVPDDNMRTRPHVADVADMIRDTDNAQQNDYALSPNGKRTLFSARGDIFSVPTEHGATRNLTSTETADEDHPAWSPDGKTVAYTTDSSGNQQLAIRPAEGGAEKLLTSFKSGYLYQPVYAPDGKALAFSDNMHRLWLVGADGAGLKQVSADPVQEIHDQSFSPDGKWLAYSLTSSPQAVQRRDIFLYEIASGKQTRLGAGNGVDLAPVWSPDGKYLYFLSSRHENTVIGDQEFNFALLKSTGIYAIPLAADTPSPVAPQSDEADSASDKPKPAEEEIKGKKKKVLAQSEPDKKGAGPVVHIDLDNIMDRAVLLPIEAANIAGIEAHGQRIYYLTMPIGLIEGTLPGEKPTLHVFDFKDRKDAVVADGVDSFVGSLDGEKILIKQGKKYSVVDAKEDAGKDGKPLDLSNMRMVVNPRAEWNEIFENAWRLERDFFFSPVMNGQNWQAVHDNYARLVPLAGSREDLNYIIGQVNGEIGNSHTYVGGGDMADTSPKIHPALLGVDYALDAASGRYTLAHIYPGDSSRDDYRSPLAAPGLNVHDGATLLAINGQDLKAPMDPDALLQLTAADQPVDLTIADSPTGTPRHITVLPTEKEIGVRELAWITHNREEVDRLSGGRVGYIYMSDMEQLGLQQFVRQFYSQLSKQALIMDDRWNGGGFVAPMALERLRRVLVALDTNREGVATSEPNQIINGPKIALLNHWSASDGDIFPYLFRQYGLGKLLGTRSWGGVRGIRGEWHMLDGGYVTIPEEAMYDANSVWIAENHGVQPDIEIENQPADLLAGHDKQLEAATDLMVKAIGNAKPGLPAPPPLIPPYPPAGMVQPQP